MPVAHAEQPALCTHSPGAFSSGIPICRRQRSLPCPCHFLLTPSSVINTSSGSRFLPFVCCYDDAAALRTGFQELTERRIADRQPAAFTTQPFHAFFLRVLSTVYNGIRTVNWLPIRINLPMSPSIMLISFSQIAAQTVPWKFRCTPVPTWKKGSNKRTTSFANATPVSRTRIER